MGNRKELEEPQDPVSKLASANHRIAVLERELQEAKHKLQQFESSEKSAAEASVETALEAPTIGEADATLRRLIQRMAMILQAEKIVIMFHDREKGELIGIPPAYGVEEDRLPHFRTRATQGISGQVFRDSVPTIFHDAAGDPRTQKDPFSLLNVSNGITVPLVIERRDEENRVIERSTIGVLHAFNKRHGEEFIDEDVRLLERMARNVGAIIANQQLYREVVEEREELLQTFESLSAGLVLLAPDGHISQMNASARAIFSAPSESIGKPYEKVFALPALRDFFAAGIRGEDPAKSEITVLVQGFERVYEVQSAVVRNEEGRILGVVTIFNDMTEIRNIDKMKSSFVAMASHELRTPLTAIKGFVSTLLNDEGFTADDRREFYTIIDQECDRLTRLINDLLNTSRIESGSSLKPHYTNVDISSLLEKCVMIQRQAGASSGHSILLEIEGELPIIVGDEDKLDQTVTNLLNNALKYSPAGGDVIVRAKVDGNDILVAVQDHGLGIPKDQLQKVFEKFHRVNNDDNRRIYGTGLGLYLVRHLVEQVHLGKIWVESEVGKGSTFYFRIPAHLDIEHAKELNN